MDELFVYCKRCGKKLKDKLSKKLGYGPTCFKQLKPKNKHILKENINEGITIHR